VIFNNRRTIDVLEQSRTKCCSDRGSTTKQHLLLPKLLFLIDILRLPMNLIYFTDKRHRVHFNLLIQRLRTGGLVNEWTNERTNKRTNVRTYKQTNKQTNFVTTFCSQFTIEFPGFSAVNLKRQNYIMVYTIFCSRALLVKGLLTWNSGPNFK
jgi:hypothetical protein